MPRLNRKKHPKEFFVAIENAQMAMKQLGYDGCIIVGFDPSGPGQWLYNHGKSKRTERAIKIFIQNNGV